MLKSELNSIIITSPHTISLSLNDTVVLRLWVNLETFVTFSSGETRLNVLPAWSSLFRKNYKLATTLFKPQGSKWVKKVAAYSLEITVDVC